MARIFVKDRYYIPASKVEHDDVVSAFEQMHYNDMACNKCWNRENRHDETCDVCPQFMGKTQLWARKKIKGVDYYIIPSGHPKRIEKKLGIDLSKAVDKRREIPFDSKLRWTGQLYHGQIIDGDQKADQVKIAEEWLAKAEITNGGLIEAPPRTGKTLLGTFITCELKVKTVITATQIEWLRQFCLRFSENTNIKAIGREGRRSPILIIDPNGWEKKAASLGIEAVKNYSKAKRPLEEYDVILVTYQQFINAKTGPKKIKKLLYNKRSLVVVDEVDQANANAFSRLLNRVPFWKKLGLTATVKRKDGKEGIVRDILGPVLARGRTIAMMPTLELLETGMGNGRRFKQWFRMERFLTDHVKRNQFIVKQAFKDLRENPNNSILIPVRHVAHIKMLTDMINKQAGINNRKRKEDWSDTLAIPYKAGVDKDKAIRMIEKGHARIVVAQNRMMTRGIDVKKWTHVYVNMIPTNNAPFFYQLATRVCTYSPGKKKPTVRIIIDNMSVSAYCFKGLFFHEIYPKLKPRRQDPARYAMSDATRKRAMEIAKYPQNYDFGDRPGAEQVKVARRW